MTAGFETPRVVYGEPRQDWLDWLRAFAILMVLTSHFQIDWQNAGIFKPVAALCMRVGWSGVDMFFVISGFLVGGLLLAEYGKRDRIDMQRFYLRRILKIWPPLYCVPLLYVLVALPYGDGRQAFGEIWPILLHIQNYIPTPLGHMWSLAVEEHFYVLLPLLIAVVGRRDGRAAVPRLLIVVAALILLVSLARIVSVMSGGVDPRTARLLTHLRIDTLLTGVFLALLYHFRQEIWNRLLAMPKTMVVIAILAAWPFVLNPNTSRVFAAFGYSSLFVLYGAVLILTASLARMSTRHWFAPPLRGLALVGRYSYPIYLFHPFIWHAFRQIGIADPVHPLLLGNSESATWIVGLVAFAAVSIAVGIAFGYAVERPLLYMRNLILPPRALSLERDVEVVTGPA